MDSPEMLRTYAAIFEKPRRCADDVLRLPTEIEQAAAKALRFMADRIEYILNEPI